MTRIVVTEVSVMSLHESSSSDLVRSMCVALTRFSRVGGRLRCGEIRVRP